MLPPPHVRLAVLCLALLELGQFSDALASTAADRGKIFVQRNCARCHAIGGGGRSPYTPAPPFRTLHERYDVGDLAEAFAEGIIVAHNGGLQMPQFMLEPEQIDDLIAYLRSIQSRAGVR